MALEILIVGSRPASEIGRYAKLAEDNGYDTVWLADERFYRDPFCLLSHLATVTTRVKLGPGITDPFVRHPALTTTAIATLDELSQGRAVLGLGAGISGFRQMGIETRKAPTAMREMVELFRKLLAGEHVDYRGEIVSFNNGELDFKPLRQHIPVHIASNGPLGQRVAGAVADVAIMAGCASPAEVRAFKAEVALGARRAGREASTVQLAARLNTCILPDGRAARDAVRVSAARYVAAGRLRTLAEQGLEVPEEALQSVKQVSYSIDHSPYAKLLPWISDRHVDACSLAGTVEEVTRHLGELFAAGIDSLIVVPYATKDATQEDIAMLLATEVWPAIATSQS